MVVHLRIEHRDPEKLDRLSPDLGPELGWVPSEVEVGHELEAGEDGVEVVHCVEGWDLVLQSFQDLLLLVFDLVARVGVMRWGK